MSESFLAAAAARAADVGAAALAEDEQPEPEDDEPEDDEPEEMQLNDEDLTMRMMMEELAAMGDSGMAESLALALQLQNEEYEHLAYGDGNYDAGEGTDGDDDEDDEENDANIDVDAMSYEELLELGERIGDLFSLIEERRHCDRAELEGGGAADRLAVLAERAGGRELALEEGGGAGELRGGREHRR